VSLKVIGNITRRYSAYDFLLTFDSNYVSISCCFWDIEWRKCRDLEIGVRGHSRSSKVLSFERSAIVYY